MEPPECQVQRRGAWCVDAAQLQQAGNAESDKGTGRLLRVGDQDPQPFHNVTRDAEKQQAEQHDPIERPLVEARGGGHPPPQKDHAADDQGQTEGVEYEFIEDVIEAVMEYRMVGRATE